MRVFDFDGTIYNGESCIDFFMYELRRHPRNIRLMPKIMHMLSRYKRLQVSTAELIAALERYGMDFLSGIDDLDADIMNFWDAHEYKFKKFYLNDHRADDVILSASPDLLINEAARRLGIKTVIASEFDLKNGKVLSLCYHSNKCERFRERFGDARIAEFYTDSENDSAVFALSDRVYMVRGEDVLIAKENI